MCAGTPCATNRSANVSSTSSDRRRRATTIARHSREYSSTTTKIFRTPRCPAVPPKQIGGDAGFVQTHEGGDIPGRRRRVPRDPRGRDVRPIVFGRADRFF